MASPGQKGGTCGHIITLFDSHSKCAHCVEKKPCEISESFSEDQKKQVATPTYRARDELQKASSPLRLLILLTLLCWGRLRARVIQKI